MIYTTKSQTSFKPIKVAIKSNSELRDQWVGGIPLPAPCSHQKLRICVKPASGPGRGWGGPPASSASELSTYVRCRNAKYSGLIETTVVHSTWVCFTAERHNLLKSTARSSHDACCLAGVQRRPTRGPRCTTYVKQHVCTAAYIVAVSFSATWTGGGRPMYDPRSRLIRKFSLQNHMNRTHAALSLSNSFTPP